MFRAICVAYAMEGLQYFLVKDIFFFFFSFGSLMFESSLPFWLLNFVDK